MMNFDALTKILDKEVKFYTDNLNITEVYAEFDLGKGVTYFEPVGSRVFEAFLSKRYRELTEGFERPDFKKLLDVKCDDAILADDNRVTLHRRVAGTLHEGITYFLADDRRRYVVITPESYTLQKKSELKFLKGAMDAAQVVPKRGGDYLNLILPKLNMDHDSALLYAVYLVQSFSRSSSHFAGIITSSKGTGKSTLTKLTTELISPALSGVVIQPSGEDDLKTMLANTYVASFDNTAPFSTTFSNILCAAITGSKAAKRKLYTNADQVILNLHNLVLINGLDAVPYKSDLNERSLYFELLPIPREKRRTDTDIWDEFDRDKPLILGAIFDTLARAMEILPTVKIKKLHRMADAHLEMMAIAMALGIDQKEFQRILDDNHQKLQNAYAANNPFLEIVLDYLNANPHVDEPAAKLYRKMEASIVGDRSFFPKSPSMLSRRLNEERDALFLAGYQFEKYKTTASNCIRITRIPQSQLTKAQKDAAARKAVANRAALLESASSTD